MTILNRLAFGPNVTKMARELSHQIMQIIPWATHVQVPSARSQKVFMLAATGGHMGPKRGPRIVVFGIGFCQFLSIFRTQF